MSDQNEKTEDEKIVGLLNEVVKNPNSRNPTIDHRNLGKWFDKLIADTPRIHALVLRKFLFTGFKAIPSIESKLVTHIETMGKERFAELTDSVRRFEGGERIADHLVDGASMRGMPQLAKALLTSCEKNNVEIKDSTYQSALLEALEGNGSPDNKKKMVDVLTGIRGAIEKIHKYDSELLKKAGFYYQHTIAHALANAPGVSNELARHVLKALPGLHAESHDAADIRKKLPDLAGKDLTETPLTGNYQGVAARYGGQSISVGF